MAKDLGLLDEVFGAFFGIALAFAILEESIPLTVRVCVLSYAPILVVILAHGAQRERFRDRVKYYAFAIASGLLVSVFLAMISPDELSEVDPITACSLPIGGFMWAFSRELLRLMLERR